MELDYLLILRQNFLDIMQSSGAYLKMSENRVDKPQQEIDILLAQLQSAKEKIDYELLPIELRPKVVAKRSKTKNKQTVDIDTRF